MEEIIGIGIDLEKNKRFRNKTLSVLKKMFTNKEISYCMSKENQEDHLSARFCAKEALIKASPIKLFYNQIEVLFEEKPFIRVLGVEFPYETKVSLTHTEDYSAAVVLVYYKKQTKVK